MGLALTIGTIAEVPVLFFGHRLIRRFRSHGALMPAAVVTGGRLLWFGARGSPVFVLAIQLLNGFTFPLLWVAGVSYADELAPAGVRTTAQALFSEAVLGFGMAVGGFGGGPLLEKVGGRGLYLVFGGIVLAIVLSVAVIERRIAPRARKDSDPEIAEESLIE